MAKATSTIKPRKPKAAARHRNIRRLDSAEKRTHGWLVQVQRRNEVAYAGLRTTFTAANQKRWPPPARGATAHCRAIQTLIIECGDARASVKTTPPVFPVLDVMWLSATVTPGVGTHSGWRLGSMNMGAAASASSPCPAMAKTQPSAWRSRRGNGSYCACVQSIKPQTDAGIPVTITKALKPPRTYPQKHRGSMPWHATGSLRTREVRGRFPLCICG